jgi:FHA domain
MTTESKNETTKLDERLSEFRDLQAQFEQTRDRLRRAEAQKNTVNRRVYERVRAEYDRELDSLRAKMTPLRTELETVRAQYEDALREANASMTSIEEELAEAVFRNRVGEFSDEDMKARREDIDGRLETARERIREMRGKLEMLDDTDEAAHAPEDLADNPALSDPVPAPDTTAAEKSQPADPPAPPASDRRPVLKRPSAGKQPGFENPQDWAHDVNAEPAHPQPDPAVDETDTAGSRPAQPAEDPVSATNPSLVFVSGPHAGQSIPLLSTTLTIGREHDNNIEIKDPDVARYHARILNERGQFVVEDMASTTGTWINGERIQRAPLKHGDVVKVGQTEIAIDFEWTLDSLQRTGVDPSA